jgi:hypothetical protein
VTNGSLLWIVPENHANEIWGTGTQFASALDAGVHLGGAKDFRRRPHHLPYGYADLVNCGLVSDSLWCFGPWQRAHDRYVGLKFLVKGKVHDGWARLNVSASKLPFKATLTGYAYETIPGKGIIAGQTKEKDDPQGPSLGALAAGANALQTWK